MTVTPQILDSFDDCDFQAVLSGTGDLLVTDSSSGLDVAVGNVDVFDFEPIEELQETVFEPGEEQASAIAITSGYRFTLVMDTFTQENLERLLVQDLTATADGSQYGLQTVRAVPVRRMIFNKDLESCAGHVCTALQVVLWRARFVGPFTLSLGRDSVVSTSYTVETLPDSVNHPTQQLGRVQALCPSVIS